MLRSIRAQLLIFISVFLAPNQVSLISQILRSKFLLSNAQEFLVIRSHIWSSHLTSKSVLVRQSPAKYLIALYTDTGALFFNLTQYHVSYYLGQTSQRLNAHMLYFQYIKLLHSLLLQFINLYIRDNIEVSLKFNLDTMLYLKIFY